MRTATRPMWDPSYTHRPELDNMDAWVPKDRATATEAMALMVTKRSI